MKKILAIIVLILSVGILTGCNKKVIDSAKFTDYMKSKGFETVDIIENLGYEVTGVDSSIYATKEADTYVVSFLVFETKEYAQQFYEKAYSDFQSDLEERYDEEEDNVKTTQVESGNFKKFTLSTNFGMNILSLVDNTVIQGETTGNKKSLSTYIEELGY